MELWAEFHRGGARISLCSTSVSETETHRRREKRPSFRNAIFLRFVKRHNESFDPLPALTRERLPEKTNKEGTPLRPDRGSINKEKSRKSVSKRGKDSKRSPNVPRNRIPSNAPISSIGGPFSRRFSCFRWAYT